MHNFLLFQSQILFLKNKNPESQSVQKMIIKIF